jgi:two-component system cell cycle sensor histidine kinase/response regulator CckA
LSRPEPSLTALIGADSVLEALIDPAVIVDDQVGIVASNPAFQRSFAADGGVPWQAVALLRDALRAVCAGERALLELETSLPVAGADAPRRFAVRAVPLRGPPPRLTLVVLRDAGELFGMREKLEELGQQLFQAQKLEAIGRLTGGVAHDFNNMLTSIICFTRFVVDDMAPEDPRRLDLIEVLKSADNAARLTNQMLAFSRRKPLVAVQLNLNDALTSVGRVLRRTLGEHIELVIEPADEPLFVVLDPGQFDQLLFNLAIQAKDAVQSGGTIVMHLSKSRVLDSAVLAPGDYAELVIVHSPRVGAARESAVPAAPSSALSLAMCRAIAEHARGTVVPTERHGAEGFQVMLPVSEEPRRGEGARRPSLAPVALTGTVLVVEDQPAILRTMVRALSSTGLRVLEAGSGEDALAVLDERGQVQPELVVTDVVLPRMSGPHLVERLRQRNPGLKALYVSGYVGDELASSVRPDENTAFVMKPFTGRQLAVRAAALLAQRSTDP